MKDLEGVEIKSVKFCANIPTLLLNDVGNFNFEALNTINIDLHADKKNRKINLKEKIIFLKIGNLNKLNRETFEQIVNYLNLIKLKISYKDNEFREIIYRFTYFDKSVLKRDLNEIFNSLLNKSNCTNTYYLSLLTDNNCVYLAFYPSFVNYIANNLISSDENFNFTSSFINERLSKYYGKKLSVIFGEISEAKSKFNIAAHDIICSDALLKEFLVKADFIVKSCLINHDYKIKESISFPAFKFEEIIKEDRYYSKLRQMFSDTKYLFFAFMNHDGYILKTVVEYKMPLSLLDTEIKKVWDETRSVISSGNIVKSMTIDKKGKYKFLTNFPAMKNNFFCHVRPHGRNSFDTYPLPYPDKLTGQTNFTKQCFWLSASYVSEIIKNGI